MFSLCLPKNISDSLGSNSKSFNVSLYLSSEINGLTEVELVDNELNLYFYNNDELVTDEFVLAIMEHNLSGVEKQIIKNLKKMIEED